MKADDVHAGVPIGFTKSRVRDGIRVGGGTAVQVGGRSEVLHGVVEALTAGRNVLLYGPPGIGKSTMLDALTIDMAMNGTRVLRTSPAEVESSLPYLALVDLFADVMTRTRGVPAHLRESLEIALLRSPGTARPVDGLAVRMAVLELLRRLAIESPVVIVIDDAQWVDEASAEVLAFAARRLGDAPVTALVAERVSDGDPISGGLCPGKVEQVPVEPLDYAGVDQLLAEQSFARLPAAMVRRVLDASGGNPLYAVELARVLAKRTGSLAEHEPLPVPDRLRALLSDRLAGLDPATGGALLLAAAMTRPSIAQLRRGGALPDDGLDAAERAQVVSVDGDGVITFHHPLLREIVYADATASQRRAAHAGLVSIVDDPVDRARHLALGNPDRDGATAALVDTAAEAAASRGAFGSAATLSRLAAERTPQANLVVSNGVVSNEAAAARWLKAARYADAAGRGVEARESAIAALTAGSPATRVAARLLLIDLAGQDLRGAAEQLAAAEQDAAGEVALEAQVALYASSLAYFGRRYAEADTQAHRAEKLARLADDADLVVRALGMQATMALTCGREDADELHEAAYRMAEDRPVTAATVEARQSWAMTALFQGDTALALREIRRLEADVRELGLVRDLMSVLISSSAIHARAGHGAAALRAARECCRLFTDAGSAPGIGLAVSAAAEWCAGSAEASIELATRAIAASESLGDTEWQEVGYAILGQALLLAGDGPAAVTAFDRAAELEFAARCGDPAIIPWHADRVEALVLAGQLEAASAAFQEVRKRVSRFRRPVIRLGLERSCAQHRAASGDPTGAVDALRSAILQFGQTSYPLDVARAWLTLGQLERRARRRAAARAAFLEARNRFTVIGAAAWLPVVDGELERLDCGTGPNTSAGKLSETENLIVHFVRSGLTNREIAAAMYLSVKAVEAHLTRLYRRFGVRNRSGLLRELS